MRTAILGRAALNSVIRVISIHIPIIDQILITTSNMDNADQYTDVFEQLHSHYILINIHDLLDYPLSELRGLAHRLEASLSLTSQQQIIHQELQQKSETNCQAKKNKKKQKKSTPIDETFGKSYELEKTNESAESSLVAELESFDINESVCYESQIAKKWEVSRVHSGYIYDGKLFIKLQVKFQGSPKTQLLGFYVCGEKKNSTLALKHLEGVRPQKRGSIERIKVEVEGKRHSFEVSKEGSNILGLDFLKEHNVVTVCNYRPECFTFELQFTS